MPDLEFHPLRETRASAARQVELMQAFGELLLERGMASMDEYGDMLKWGLPSRDGFCRYFHVYHPGYCSFEDRFYGTVHYHGGQIRGTVLLGGMDHHTYEMRADADGERIHEGRRYAATRHTRHQPQGTQYALPAHVPHWLKPTALTLTYFEEEDNGEMGDLVGTDETETDTFLFEQEHAEGLVGPLLEAIETRIQALNMARTA